jgi:hypothetical protein
VRSDRLEFVRYFMGRCADVGFGVFVFVEEVNVFVFFRENFAILTVGSMNFVEKTTWAF